MSATSLNALGWVLEWFARRLGKPAASLDASTNYFEAGWIDSLGIMDLVLDAESRFGLKFTERNFQDRRFASMQGLSQIIEEISLSVKSGGAS